MNKQTPPDWMDRLLEWYCTDYYLEEVQGDLHEWYAKVLTQPGSATANLRYLLYVLRYFRWFRLKPFHQLFSNPNPYNMKNLVILTFRHFRRDRLTGAVRMVNLVLGITVFLLAWVYMRYELAYDQHHDDVEQIHRVSTVFEKPWAATPVGLGHDLVERSADVQAAVRLYPMYTANVSVGEEVFREENGFWADSTLTEVLSLDFIHGNPAEALKDPESVILTESMARKYFGTTDAVGKTLRINADYGWRQEGVDRTVTAIIADLPEQTHLTFDFVASVHVANPQFLSEWRNFWVYTYVRLRPQASPAATEALVKELLVEQYELTEEEQDLYGALLTPIEEIHLFTNFEKEFADNGNAYYVYVLFSIGIFVLIIASINFVNLTVIRGLDRAKEVGLRKTIGASRLQVILQFMGETWVLLLLAGILSVVLLAAVAPIFQQFSGLALPLNALRHPELLGWLVAILAVLEIGSGIYPAWVLSRLMPAQSVKAGPSQRRIGLTRQALIVTQFALSLVLVVASLVVYRQLDFLQQKDLGFEKDQLLSIQANYPMRQSYDTWVAELERVAGVQSVANSSSIPGYRIMNETVVRPDDPEAYLDTRLLYVNAPFLKTYQLSLAEGTDLTEQLPNTAAEIMLNETAAEAFFPEQSAVGQALIFGRDTCTVVGVVEDFNFQSLHTPVEPLTMLFVPRHRFERVTVRFHPEATAEVLAGLEAIRKEHFPEEPALDVEFIDDRFAQLYQAESKLQTVVWVFCIITVLLTLSGTLGVATYHARKRAKEIAVRKVLGSSTPQLLQLLSRGFLILLGISLLIGIPGAWWLTDWWLADFAYRISLSATTFMAAGILLSALVVTSAILVTLRAAHANPAEVLKAE